MTNLAKPIVKDEFILERPKGVYTEIQRKNRRSQSCEIMPSSNTCEYDVKKHRRALSLQPYIREGRLSTHVHDWTPKPLADGTYGSSAMQNLCEEFGMLAADVVNGFAGK